ncbi:DUF975 family protein [Streptococcus didelphis]|nr:DUF975 family protein [Streptococcus didelphis]WMB29815.1 DUF975 family protein [Streptococcus didelphis]
MKIRHIKKEAKATLKKLPGKYTLFLIPILIQFALIGLQVHKNHLIGEGVQMSLTASFFPILLNIIAGFFTLSAAFTMISVIRNKRQSVSFSDTSLAFSTDYFGKIIVLYLLKTLLILVWSLVLFLGLALLIISYFAYLSNAGVELQLTYPYFLVCLGFLLL